MRTPFAFVLFALALIGCPSPLGTECTTDCPSGYLCIVTEAELDVSGVFYRPVRSICARQCSSGRDCAAGINCYRGANRFAQDLGYCSEFGSAPEGATCSSSVPAAVSCGPGLTCNQTSCAPACNLASSHVEDRRCPAGMQCELGIPGGFCAQPPCDVLAPRETQCQFITDGEGNTLDMICRRFTNPGLGEGTICDTVDASRRCDDGTECVVGEVCSASRCYARVDAPPMTPEQLGLTIPSD